MPKNVSELPIAIVNEDKGDVGATVAKNLKSELPFKHIKENLSDKDASEKLDHNDLALVIKIHSDFSEKLKDTSATSNIDFEVNKASPTMISSSVESIATAVNTNLDKAFTSENVKRLLKPTGTVPDVLHPQN